MIAGVTLPPQKPAKSPSSAWPAVVLVVSLMACVTVLAALHVDLSAVAALVPVVVLPVLGVLLARVQKVEHNTNGTTSALVEQVRQLTDALANSVPATTVERRTPNDRADHDG